jgi:hypothetical protein
VVIQPNLFHRLMEPLHVREWQVIREADKLRILLGQPAESVDMAAVVASLTRGLRDAGAEPPPVKVEIVDAVIRTKLGKAQLVKALRAPSRPRQEVS